MGYIVDVLSVMNVFDDNDFSEKYDTIYFHSNENLKDIFSEIDVTNKDVLTVLGSGDQVFYSYNNGARNVEAFDRNKLAIYYYYLRTWVIKYFNLFYPSILNKKYIRTLLKLVEPHSKEENIALKFWKFYTRFFSDEDTRILFSVSNNYGINELVDKAIIQYAKSYNVDISKNVDFDKKYDIIFTSNVADYVLQDENQLKIYRDNLSDLLRGNGIIVRCHVINGIDSKMERRIFLEKFYSREISSRDNKKVIGLVYTKRKKR